MKNIEILLMLIFTLLAVFSQKITAQTFTEVSGTPFPGFTQGDLAVADVNGDTHLDVLITGTTFDPFARIAKLYTNNGSGTFTEVSTPFEGVGGGGIAFGDVNGDGHIDVLITGFNISSQRIAKLYTNNGTGTFTEVMGTPFEGGNFGDVEMADIDGDLDLDVIIAGNTGNSGSTPNFTKMYTNDGSGNFTEVMGTPFSNVGGGCVIKFVDVDGDSDVDVFLAGNKASSGSNNIAELYTNDGTGNFTLVNGTPFVGVNLAAANFADVNGDTHLDLILSGNTVFPNRITHLYTNDGTGNFSLVSGTPFDAVQDGSVFFGDPDEDNDQDLIITGTNSSNQNISKYYSNDGSGNFTLVGGTPFDGVIAGEGLFADVKGSSAPELFIAGQISGLNLTCKLFEIESPATITLNLQNNPTDVAETANVTNALTYRFTRTGGNQSNTLTVNFSIHGNGLTFDDITATASSGLITLSQNLTGNITFNANNPNVDLVITPKEDNLVELTEEVGVKIEPF